LEGKKNLHFYSSRFREDFQGGGWGAGDNAKNEAFESKTDIGAKKT